MVLILMQEKNRNRLLLESSLVCRELVLKRIILTNLIYLALLVVSLLYINLVNRLKVKSLRWMQEVDQMNLPKV